MAPPRFLLQVGRGVREAWPSPGGLYEEVVGFPCVLDTTGCKGWPPLSGHLLHVSGRSTSVSSVCPTVRCCLGVLRGCVPPGRCGRTCRRVRLRVLGGRPMRRIGAPRRLLKFACTRAGRAARVSASVRTAGCRQLPSASAHDPVACAVRQHPRGHRFGRGLRVFGWPLCPAPRGPVTWERRVR